MESLVRIHNKLKMKYENKQCSKPEVGIFATDSDSVPDLQQIYNRFLVDHRFKIGCKLQLVIHRLKFGCKSVVITDSSGYEVRTSASRYFGWLADREIGDRKNVLRHDLWTPRTFIEGAI